MNDDAPNHDNEGAWGEVEGDWGDGGDDLGLSNRLSVGVTLQLLSPSPLLPSQSIVLALTLRYCK